MVGAMWTDFGKTSSIEPYARRRVAILESDIGIDIQFRLIDVSELPAPRGRADLAPGKEEGLAQAVDPLHHHLRDRAAVAADFHSRAGGRRSPTYITIVGAIFDGEKKELREDLLRVFQGGFLVVAPAVRKIIREKIAGRRPVPPLDFFQKMGRMQSHLPFRLPEPEQP